MAYYATSVNTGTLGGDVYLNTFIAGALEFPADIMCVFIIIRLGRRWSLSMGMLMGGIFMIACVPLLIANSEYFTVHVFNKGFINIFINRNHVIVQWKRAPLFKQNRQ